MKFRTQYLLRLAAALMGSGCALWLYLGLVFIGGLLS